MHEHSARREYSTTREEFESALKYMDRAHNDREAGTIPLEMFGQRKRFEHGSKERQSLEGTSLILEEYCARRDWRFDRQISEVKKLVPPRLIPDALWEKVVQLLPNEKNPATPAKEAY